MARLCADENFPLPPVAELRRFGHDALTIHETGQAGQAMPDEAVLGYDVAVLPGWCGRWRSGFAAMRCSG